MSIFIKGMEMPRNCESCTVAHLAECELWMTAGYKLRHKDCPLVEVPTPHGDLIDRERLKVLLSVTLEALKRFPQMGDQGAHLVAAFWTLQGMIEDASVIIDAEEGEEA
jgi:hypothetical protein